MLKEIKPPTLTQIMRDMGYKPSSGICPNCSAPMYYGTVPCPDGKPGCCVIHYGHTCVKCGKKWSGG